MKYFLFIFLFGFASILFTLLYSALKGKDGATGEITDEELETDPTPDRDFNSLDPMKFMDQSIENDSWRI